ncbi:hypothetical protein BM477_06695 [Boudabousia marimammalium]|uniref:Uncharacterized protein n=2 Tax=Boudabousia marimammalium TaxID=156892 RepID=A0A1Q5PL69_9ACTO|nr:hypothetical protein BM477_06695 [Boudabousia marimammalium]
MANRPVFRAETTIPFFSSDDVEFKFFSGFSVSQKQKSIASLHEAYLAQHSTTRIIDISSKSPDDLGVQLSAFNLMITHSRGQYSVESAFQASKCFEHGGPYEDLLMATSREAKRDSRLHQSGSLTGFRFYKYTFPLEPKTYFYDWLYAKALQGRHELLEKIVEYDAMTDIEFNPAKSINCQARSVAKVVGLFRKGLLESALESPARFLEIGYRTDSLPKQKDSASQVEGEQTVLF